jgi:ribonuclease HII
MLIIGTDEAGYGPNLGPLVVTATCWRMLKFDFSSVVSAAVGTGVDIGDSKQLYHSGGSLEKLSRGVLSALCSVDILPKTDAELFDIVGGVVQLPFMYAKPDFSLQKISADWEMRSERFFLSGLFQGVRSRIIFPNEYNAMLKKYGSKGELLSNVTLKLVVRLIEDWGGNGGGNCGDDLLSGVLVLCDKHGGRNCYVELLSRYFRDDLVCVKVESREVSIYKLRGIEFRFIAKGESQVPIALASMFSKYIRELLMHRFNFFWQTKIPTIKPTAGYPEDAKRFIKEIENVLQELKIDKNEIWRLK